MNPIITWTVYTTLGLTLAYGTYRAVARHMRHKQYEDKNRYLHDITPSMFPNAACACCGGTASHLRYDNDARALVCKDRRLCREVMIYTNMIKDVESA